MKAMRKSSSNIASITLFTAIAALALVVHFSQKYMGPFPLLQTTPESNPTSYPRRATDQDGQQLTLPDPIQRAASQYWSIDEMFYAVLPPEYVVGVSQYAYDINTSNVVQFAETYRPVITANPEAVLTAAPDLLVVSSSARADLTDLVRNAGIPTFRLFTEYRTLDEIARNIVLIGYLTGQDTRAQHAHEVFKRAIERATARKPAGMPSPRVLGYSGKYSYGRDTSFSDVLRVLGATNVAAEQGLRGYEAVNTEQILRWNPEWLISRSDDGEKDVVLRRLLNDPAIAATTAAQRKQILVLDNRIFLPMSPYTAKLLDVLGEAFYGRSPKS